MNLYVNTDLQFKMAMLYGAGLCLIPKAAPVLMAIKGRDFQVLVDPALPDDTIVIRGERGNVVIYNVGGR